MNEPEFLTTTQAARLLGIGGNAIQRAMKSGVLPFVQAGRYRLIRPADLRAWFETPGNYHPNMAVWLGKQRRRKVGRPKGSKNRAKNGGRG